MWSFHSLQKSDRERIAPVAHYKRATMRDSLTLLFKKERKVRFAEKTHANRTFALSLTKNERFARKTDERIRNPANTAQSQKNLTS